MKKINIIYLLPEMKGASGGAKVIYNHSLKLNSIKKGISSNVIHLKKKLSYKIENSLSKKFKIFNEKDTGWNPRKMKVSKFFSPSKDWFSKNINSKKKLLLDKNTDFLIIPEIWSHFPEDLKLKKKGINYGIFIQGFYHMNSTSNFKKLKSAYKNAKIILISSEYNIKCFKEMFPEFKNKILKINFSINSEKLKITKKINTITYMPRKLSNHSQLLLFYLKNLLPNNWKIIPLENVSENYLIKSLSRSKFFLSFSNFEGLGIPPIEAALSGNKVIGYTGGGGIEYWKEPIFKKIENGDISSFGKKLLYEIKNYKKNWIIKTKKNRAKLERQYSAKKEKKTLNLLINKIIKIYNI
tara:strand:- start:85 stop:1146 length:1062 start_codon:yes stop_codon:yes gene_type:complete